MIYPDFTPGIEVPVSHRRTYRLLRALLYTVFFALAVAFFIRLVYFDERGRFDFEDFAASRNTIADPRYADGLPAREGRIPVSTPMSFNMAAPGSFAEVEVRMTVADGSPGPTTVSLLRSYRAFLYPEGPPAGFRDGSLLRIGEKYGVVSGGEFRPFGSAESVRSRGYDTGAFRTVSEAEVSIHPSGEPVVAGEYAPGMIVVSDGSYYRYHDGRFLPFVSGRAYLTSYRPEDALSVDIGVIRQVGADDTMIGFADGTLISYGESVYAVEGNVLRPIDSVDTFLIKGYDWQSVVAATGEEFGMYERGRLYTRKQPHPSGTIFAYPEENRSFLIDSGRKREIRGPNILQSYGSVTPVVVDAVTLRAETCDVREGFWPGTYRCDIPFDRLKEWRIPEYQFEVVAATDSILKNVEVTFVRSIDRENFALFAESLIGRLRTRYVGE